MSKFSSGVKSDGKLSCRVRSDANSITFSSAILTGSSPGRSASALLKASMAESMHLEMAEDLLGESSPLTQSATIEAEQTPMQAQASAFVVPIKSDFL